MKITNVAHHFEYMQLPNKSYGLFKIRKKKNLRQTNLGCHISDALEMMSLVSLTNIPLFVPKPVMQYLENLGIFSNPDIWN